MPPGSGYAYREGWGGPHHQRLVVLKVIGEAGGYDVEASAFELRIPDNLKNPLLRIHGAQVF